MTDTELLRRLGSLSDDVQAMRAYVRSRMRGGGDEPAPRARSWRAEARRISEDVGELADRYEEAASGRGRRPRSKAQVKELLLFLVDELL